MIGNRKNMNFRKLNQQKGFTFIEIAVVSVILMILVAGVVSLAGGKQEDSRFTNLKMWAMKDAPSAINSYTMRVGEVAALQKSDLTDRGLSGENPWGENWTITGVNNRLVSISMPLTTAVSPDEVGNQFVEWANNEDFNHLRNVNYDSGSSTLTFDILGG